MESIRQQRDQPPTLHAHPCTTTEPEQPAPATEPPLATVCGVLSAVCAVKAAVGAIAPGPFLSSVLGPAAVTPENAALFGVVASASWLVAAWLQALKVRLPSGGD